MGKRDADIERQLNRVGRSLRELEQNDPLYSANIVSNLTAKNDLLIQVLESILNEQDSLVERLKSSRDRCIFCVHNRTGKRADVCDEQDYMCAYCHVECPCKDCDSGSAFCYGRRKAQPVAKAGVIPK